MQIVGQAQGVELIILSSKELQSLEYCEKCPTCNPVDGTGTSIISSMVEMRIKVVQHSLSCNMHSLAMKIYPNAPLDMVNRAMLITSATIQTSSQHR